MSIAGRLNRGGLIYTELCVFSTNVFPHSTIRLFRRLFSVLLYLFLPITRYAQDRLSPCCSISSICSTVFCLFVYFVILFRGRLLPELRHINDIYHTHYMSFTAKCKGFADASRLKMRFAVWLLKRSVTELFIVFLWTKSPI